MSAEQVGLVTMGDMGIQRNRLCSGQPELLLIHGLGFAGEYVVGETGQRSFESSVNSLYKDPESLSDFLDSYRVSNVIRGVGVRVIAGWVLYENSVVSVVNLTQRAFLIHAGWGKKVGNGYESNEMVHLDVYARLRKPYEFGIKGVGGEMDIFTDRGTGDEKTNAYNTKSLLAKVVWKNNFLKYFYNL